MKAAVAASVLVVIAAVSVVLPTCNSSGYCSAVVLYVVVNSRREIWSGGRNTHEES